MILINGSNNIGDINQNNTSAIQDLNELIDFIGKASITDDDKRDLIGDVEAIKAQLAKRNPAKAVIKTLWSGVSGAANLAGASELVAKISNYLEQITK